MTTTTATKAPMTPAQVERASALAAKLLTGRVHGKALPAAAAAFGKAIATTPPGSAHGQVLACVLRQEGQQGNTEQATLWLATRGETPTPQAVAAAVPQLASRLARQARLAAAAAPFVEADGERAAGYVAKVIGGTGEGPTWAELGNVMGWPDHPLGLRGEVIHELARARWLRFGRKPYSLRPGPGAREGA
jgi:hypothetical protein